MEWKKAMLLFLHVTKIARKKEKKKFKSPAQESTSLVIYLLLSFTLILSWFCRTLREREEKVAYLSWTFFKRERGFVYLLKARSFHLFLILGFDQLFEIRRKGATFRLSARDKNLIFLKAFERVFARFGSSLKFPPSASSSIRIRRAVDLDGSPGRAN